MQEYILIIPQINLNSYKYAIIKQLGLYMKRYV